MEIAKICNEREIRIYMLNFKFTKKACSQIFLDHLRSTFINSMSIYIKEILLYNSKNLEKYI